MNTIESIMFQGGYNAKLSKKGGTDQSHRKQKEYPKVYFLECQMVLFENKKNTIEWHCPGPVKKPEVEKYRCLHTLKKI